MEILITIGKFFLVILAVLSVARILISERRNYQFVLSIWRRFQITIFFECLGILTLTIAVGIALWRIPGFNYGWINLFFGGEAGNMLIKPIIEGSKSSNILVCLMVLVFFIALALVLPFLAHTEEKIFRKGYDEWSAIVKQSIKFGLAHCFVGVPLAAGIALIIPGLFYGFKYKGAFERNVDIMDCWRAEEEAVMVSTAYHTMYNTICVTAIFAALVARIGT
jgi:hypothetical protein